ncbi:hypothetical protein RA210_U130004 [Rubrivivax sp. A210]|nr:hypothetical protein RA210_U130004 [Rubrivivax sp. A210]
MWWKKWHASSRSKWRSSRIASSANGTYEQSQRVGRDRAVRGGTVRHIKILKLTKKHSTFGPMSGESFPR